MEVSNIQLGDSVHIDPSSTINNVKIGDRVRIAKFCSIYGSKENMLEIGAYSYIGMFTILNGYAGGIKIGQHVSIAQNVNMMTDSGPNASEFMQQFYPLQKGRIVIEDHVWIGTGVIIMPGVTVGRCSIIAANSFVSQSIEPYSLYAGNPARLVKKLEDIKANDCK